MGRPVLEVLYPRACRVCEEPLESEGGGLSEWFCDQCQDALPKVDAPLCKMCGEPYDGEITHQFRCANCADLKYAFEFAIAGYRADAGVRELIHQFKYSRDYSLRGAMGRLLLRALDDPRLAAENLQDWLLVPVPLHWWKRRKRAFNQSHEICKVLGKLTGLRTIDCLKRVRNTGVQAALDRQKRLSNLSKAFSMRWRFAKSKRLAGRNILLVDDVLTTGATTHECARILKKDGGVGRVVVITVARG